MDLQGGFVEMWSVVIVSFWMLFGGLMHGEEGLRETGGFSVFSPRDYQVFQRNSREWGTIEVRGEISVERGLTAQIQWRLVDPQQNSWKDLEVEWMGRAYRGLIQLPAGGWYRMECRCVVDDEIVGRASIAHVGVGEVFIVAGQSNSANHGEVRQHTQTEKVSVVHNDSWQLAHDPQPGASGEGGSFLPVFGDRLVKRFKVPVGLVACGIGATSVREWLPRGCSFPNPPTLIGRVEPMDNGLWRSKGEAFDMLVERARVFGRKGFRAVLWHQGESDANQKDPSRTLPGGLYRDSMERLIRNFREQCRWEAPWFVALASYHSADDVGSEAIREAQSSLWHDGVALEGPDSDALRGSFRDNGGRGVHFSDLGLKQHGTLWAECVENWLIEELARVR